MAAHPPSYSLRPHARALAISGPPASLIIMAMGFSSRNSSVRFSSSHARSSARNSSASGGYVNSMTLSSVTSRSCLRRGGLRSLGRDLARRKAVALVQVLLPPRGDITGDANGLLDLELGLEVHAHAHPLPGPFHPRLDPHQHRERGLRDLEGDQLGTGVELLAR